jgi:hypothetical protein
MRCWGASRKSLLCVFLLPREQGVQRGTSERSAKRTSGCVRCRPSAPRLQAVPPVHVGDRGADLFPFFQACQQTQTQFLVRAAQNRRVQGQDAAISTLLTQVRSWPGQASRPFEVPARHGRTGRATHLQLACGPMTRLPPRQEPRAGKEPVAVWVIRVWEEQAKAAEELLEWVLVTSVPTTTLEQGWERVEWYR